MNSFESIIGYEDIKSELSRVLDIIKNPEKYNQFSVKAPSGILLHGKTGLGKTMFANLFLRATGRPNFVCRKDRPDGEFVLEIKNVFEKAMVAAPSIILLDDMDKFTNTNRRRSDDEEFVTIQSCIDKVRSEGKDVFVFATVNNIQKLPDSLIRVGRFDKVIEVKAPNSKDAEKIIEHYLSGKPITTSIDCKELAYILQGHSCAELESIINEAGIYAGYSGREEISKDDILKAVMRTVFNAPESIEPREDKYKRIVAIHEAGHALVSELNEPGSVNLVSVNHHSSGIGGITSYYQNENYFYDITFMENRIMSLLGGRAATEIKLGIADIGAKSDTFRAFDIVERLIGDYCSYGFDKFERGNSSQIFLERKETYVHAELDRFYARVKHMVAENILLLDKITEALMEKGTITRADILELKNG